MQLITSSDIESAFTNGTPKYTMARVEIVQSSEAQYMLVAKRSVSASRTTAPSCVYGVLCH
ncbi:hypothetical protein SCLCIDRAFT_1208026 [Scleroderma citrinum Foug A]|uniref:Uncharacterized protein n=1 Tax=Scleroderma citrinum Foug A TaxID=1036808 RepID=A0A0C3EP07_9AGAM|nr:hypothetical protein SCLCIDRAFT_1208026 [Scleroderma citrinum Foug A]